MVLGVLEAVLTHVALLVLRGVLHAQDLRDVLLPEHGRTFRIFENGRVSGLILLLELLLDDVAGREITKKMLELSQETGWM